MRQGQSAKRSRGRSGGGGGRRNGSPRHQSFDSNGPSIRIRGNASQVYEKYIQLARDANAAGDRITAENMYQHAEHYFRLMNVDDGQQNRGNGADNRQQNRNVQPEQEQSSATVAEAGTPNESAAAESSESPPRLNGSEEKGRRPRADVPVSAADDADANTEKPSEVATERAPRRPRRSPRSRARPAAEAAPTSEAAEVPVPAPVSVKTEAVSEPVPSEVEVKDAP